MRKTINWTAARVKELRHAYETAVAARTPNFELKITGHGTEKFDVHYARHLLGELDRLFAENPMPVFEPNREGKEGE